MGASKINESWEDFEPRWALPGGKHDTQWLQVQLQQLFDSDFLRKEFRGLVPLPKVTRDNESVSHDVNTDLHEAVAYLADIDSSVGIRQTASRLARILTSMCRQEDPFGVVVAQRVHILRCLHFAMNRMWPRSLASCASLSFPRSADIIAAPAAEKSSNVLYQPVPARPLPYGAQLGTKLFYALLNFVSDSECDVEQRVELLAEVSAIVLQLPELCLAEKDSKSGDEAQILGGKEVGVLDTLRNFLYVSMIPTAFRGLPPASDYLCQYQNSFSEPSSEYAALSAQDRSIALTTLIALGMARGCAYDLLLAVKVLLCVKDSYFFENIKSPALAKDGNNAGADDVDPEEPGNVLAEKSSVNLAPFPDAQIRILSVNYNASELKRRVSRKGRFLVKDGNPNPPEGREERPEESAVDCLKVRVACFLRAIF
jgi:hypothetical protein